MFPTRSEQLKCSQHREIDTAAQWMHSLYSLCSERKQFSLFFGNEKHNEGDRVCVCVCRDISYGIAHTSHEHSWTVKYKLRRVDSEKSSIRSVCCNKRVKRRRKARGGQREWVCSWKFRKEVSKYLTTWGNTCGEPKCASKLHANVCT